MQEEIADGVIAMLKGAMETLIVGDPGDPATDVGPVIDQAAYDRLMTYRESREGRLAHDLRGAGAERTVRAADADPVAVGR